MNLVKSFRDTDELIDVINAATIGRSVPYSGGAYTGSAERLAATYAANAVKDFYGLAEVTKEAEAYLDELAQLGARFDFAQAVHIARRLLIERVLERARQDYEYLGGDAPTAKVVARVLLDDGHSFCLWGAGTIMDEVRLSHLCAVAGGVYDRANWRFVFPNGSAIAVYGDFWEVEKK